MSNPGPAFEVQIFETSGSRCRFLSHNTCITLVLQWYVVHGFSRSGGLLPRVHLSSRIDPQCHSSAVVATVASLVVLPTALGQTCPISSFDSFDFSNVALEQCTDLRSPSGCDACFAAVLRPVVSVLDYLPIDESSTCSSSFENISDTLLNRCQNGFARAIQRQLGIRDALRLMGLLRCPAPKLENSPQTTAVATEYYASKGVDLMSLCAYA